MPSLRFHRQFAWLPLLLFLITALALIIGAVVLHYVEADLVAGAGNTLVLAAVDIADKLDRILFERYSDINRLAETLMLLQNNPEAMTSYLTTVQRAHPIYVWIGVMDVRGRIVVATDPTSVGQESERSPLVSSRAGWHAGPCSGCPVLRGFRRRHDGWLHGSAEG